MTNTINKVVIVGGGTAGWITAGLLARKHRANKPDGIKLTLVESSDIATIGVGEGTWPTMRSTLKKIGLSENDFLINCHASFKQGSKFVHWVDGSGKDFYYHPFSPPAGGTKIDLAPYWGLRDKNQQAAFAETVDFQQSICESGRAPKMITTPEYGAVTNYGYHLDAGRFSELLKRFCVNQLGVQHVVDTVTKVNQHADGDIISLTTDGHGDVPGDLFIDCSGFSALLIGKTMGVPFKSKSRILFADHALAMQVPHADENTPIACQTISTAHEAGWTWDIGLTNRRGTGYVYSSQHVSHEQAEQTLRDYVGPASEDLNVRRIPINSGHRQRFWEKNCVAVGLSAGFLEPLEASALMLIELSADMISERLPACRDVMDITAAQFNETFCYRWDRIIDFLKLHYLLSQRDSGGNDCFWRDNRAPESIPDSLQALLELWKYHSPASYDLSSNNEVFSWASYQYVLYGMGYKTDFSLNQHSLSEWDTAEKLFAQNQTARQKAMNCLPQHRELLNKVREFGFQRV